MTIDPNLLYSDPKKRGSLIYSMTGQNPAFYPGDPPAGSQPPNYGTNFNPSLGVTASGTSGGYSPNLPANYNFNDLASYEEAARNAYGQSASADILNTRDKLSKSLADYGTNFFNQQNPAILEDLNRRGLFQSPTAVNEGQANALKDIALSNESYLRDFDTSALSARLQAQQDALDAGSNLRSTGLEANLNETQAQREEQMARDLAKQSGRNQLNGALIGAGGSLLGGAAPEIIKGLLAKKAATTVATTGAQALAGDATAGTAGEGGGIGAAALPAAGVAAGLGLYEGTRKELVNHGYGKNEAKIVASMPLVNIPYIAGKAALKSAGFGAGHTQNGNAIASTASSLQSQRSDLTQLKQAHDSGQINDADYNAQLLPALKQYNQMVNSALGQGSVWASSIKPEWDALVKTGMVKAVNGQWVTDTGQVLWDPKKGYSV